jgi:hypothetical protein
MSKHKRKHVQFSFIFLLLRKHRQTTRVLKLFFFGGKVQKGHLKTLKQLSGLGNG